MMHYRLLASSPQSTVLVDFDGVIRSAHFDRKPIFERPAGPRWGGIGVMAGAAEPISTQLEVIYRISPHAED